MENRVSDIISEIEDMQAMLIEADAIGGWPFDFEQEKAETALDLLNRAQDNLEALFDVLHEEESP